MRWRVALILGLLSIASAGGCRDDALEAQAQATCEAVDAERFDEALTLSGSGSSAVGAGRRIAECRCIALLSLGDRDGCTALLDPLLRAPEAQDWVPHAVLTKLILRTWQASGQSEAAAALAARAAPVHREDLDLLQLELMLRAPGRDEAELLAEIGSRIEDDPSWIPQRLVLALAFGRRGQHVESIRVLGDTAPALESPLSTVWYESRIKAQAASGDLAAVKQTFADWRRAGGDPIDLAARYALRLSTDQLADPEHDTIDLLRAAIATSDALRDRNIVWGLHRRLISHLLVEGRPEEALAAFDAASGVVDLTGVSRDEIVRAVRGPSDPAAPIEAARVVFRIPSELAGGRLVVSPDAPEAAARPDADYHDLALEGAGERALASSPGLHPRRWVVRDASGAVRGSGAFWPEPGTTQRIEVEPRPPAARPVAFAPARRPGDGRRRVIAILPDCGDWRLVQYLRARGELPFHDHLLEQGHRAVLESRPAFTAAALQSLVWPAKPRVRATLDWIHDLGLELAGLEAVGSNPVGFLGLVLPERPNLFETLGEGDRVTANMLLAHGRIDAGRHAEIVGPDGHHRTLPSQAAYRPLAEAELARFPSLVHDRDTKKFAETIAAEMDAAERIVREGEIDFLFLRLEALDLLTHAHFGPLDGRGQDDGRGPLLDTYRYIDERLAILDRLLDRDDWLVYLSDHGIRSSMQHEEDAIFAVLGEGVPKGRAPGKPALRGIPRSLASMLGVETDWPETGAGPAIDAKATPTGAPARVASIPARAR
ncbi:MAG: alkaline phosphatase family protein [Deltaproteobacteria bacterium]|nr:alkaline phosphatase family protein [Deltaproteobacteria bacterium]